jgi:hypothetical protein
MKSAKELAEIAMQEPITLYEAMCRIERHLENTAYERKRGVISKENDFWLDWSGMPHFKNPKLHNELKKLGYKLHYIDNSLKITFSHLIKTKPQK